MKKSLLTIGAGLAIVAFAALGRADTGSESTPDFFFTRLDPCHPEMYSGQTYRMGINFIIYAMSH